MRQLILATRNTHKTREFTRMLGAEFAVSDLASLPVDLPEIEETGSTFEENATLKAVATSRVVAGLVIADDSGLEVDVLGGGPGVYSARYAGPGATDAGNVEKLLRELANAGANERAAQFRCVIALARGGEVIRTFEGIVRGDITDARRGGGGFGYDPIFKPEGAARTFAEMTDDAKNAVSHRGRAIARMRRFLASAAAAP